MFLQLFQWFDTSALGNVIRDSTYLFPWIEAIHLIALAVLGGTVLVVDMRMLGIGLTGEPLPRLAKAMSPWVVSSLVVMLVTGYLLMVSEAMKCYENVPFWFKMGFLALAILFTFTIRRRVTLAPVAGAADGIHRAVGLTSFLLWSAVGIAGRGIGFW